MEYTHLQTEITLGIDVDVEKEYDLSERISRQNHFSVAYGPRGLIYVGYLVQKDGSSMKVALKLVGAGATNAEINHYRKVLRQEIQMWRTFNHRNVLPFLGITSGLERDGFPALVSPFCNNGTVVSFLKRHPLSSRIFMVLNIIEGLIYLHGINVTHGDLKPNNILIDDHGNPVLCDFGCSWVMGQLEYNPESIAGSIRYQACELLEPSDMIKATPASDVYSFGMISYEIWSGRPPYHEDDDTSTNGSLQTEIASYKRPSYPNPEPIGTENLWPILKKFWEKDPRLRPTSMEVRRLLHNIWPAASPSILHMSTSTTTTTLYNDAQIASQATFHNYSKVTKHDGMATPLPILVHSALMPRSLETNPKVEGEPNDSTQAAENKAQTPKVTAVQDGVGGNTTSSPPNSVHLSTPEVEASEENTSQPPPSSPLTKSFKRLFRRPRK